MAIYFSEIFKVKTLARAKAVILTDEGPGADSETRWQQETPYLMELIGQMIGLETDTLVLDYRCGIGRPAKATIEASGCSVIGVDISAEMRAMARGYVGSERFLAASPSQFDRLVQAGLGGRPQSRFGCCALFRAGQ
ncbi:MAG TPA: hypothetical protein VMB34_15880 [Acetobacteraceae bacterium]|nr:hypothetical protein [Acetobacteraceae bacterium]